MNVSFPTISNAIVTQIFGNYAPSMYGGDGRHKGLDLGVISGTSVYACMGGDVITAINTQTGYGRYIKLHHEDGSESIYGHLTKLLVNVGDYVYAGQEIGKSGGDPLDGIDGDGFSTGAHLHWEIRPPESLMSDQGAVDPELWCKKYLVGQWREAQITADIGLRVRSRPVDGTILYVLPKRELIKVVEVVNGWARIQELRESWCSADWIYFTGITSGEEQTNYTDAEKLAKLWDLHPELH